MHNLLYRLASLLGDINAVRRGTVVRRVVRKAAWRAAGRLLNKVLK